MQGRGPGHLWCQDVKSCCQWCYSSSTIPWYVIACPSHRSQRLRRRAKHQAQLELVLLRRGRWVKGSDNLYGEPDRRDYAIIPLAVRPRPMHTYYSYASCALTPTSLEIPCPVVFLLCPALFGTNIPMLERHTKYNSIGEYSRVSDTRIGRRRLSAAPPSTIVA